MSAPEQDYDQDSATWTGGDHGAGAATDATAAAATGTSTESAGMTEGGRGGPQVAQQNMHYIEETGRWTYTDAEGISFEYDENLKAWFPMFNEQLIQAQQSIYGETIPDNLESVYAENARRQKRKNESTDDIYHSGATAAPGNVGSHYSNNNNNNGDDDDDEEEHDEDRGDAHEILGLGDYPPGLASIPGQSDGSSNNKYANKKQKQPKGKGERKPKPISSVFVTGLPLDTDLEEVMDVFKKGGVFMEDENEQPRIKLYTNSQGQRNGEGLVTYLRPESVALAIDLLDDTEYRPGVEKGRIRVQQAQFKEKERTATPAGLTDERKKKVQKKYQKLEKKLDWFDDENLVKADKWNKVCILKHMFTIQELEADPTLLLDLKEDIREECEKVGEVTNVIIYDHHPEGVVSVRYKEKESADLCVKLMSGRFFAGQRVVAEIYDGHTKYESQKSKEELEEEEKQRLDRYARWLEAEEEKSKAERGAAPSFASEGSGQKVAGVEEEGEGQVRIAADAPTP